MCVLKCACVHECVWVASAVFLACLAKPILFVLLVRWRVLSVFLYLHHTQRFGKAGMGICKRIFIVSCVAGWA